MSIIRIKKKEHPYVQVDKRVLEDRRLSWRAKGILVYLLTKPDGWTVKVADIWGKGQEGRGAVQACLKELNKYGYAQLVTTKGDGTTFAGKEWQVNEEPIGGFLASTDKPKTDAPINRKSVSRSVNSNNESLSEINNNNEGERTPHTPNPSNLKEEKNENGLVAPGRCDADEFFAKKSAENPETVKAEIPPSKKVALKKDSPEPVQAPPGCYACTLGVAHKLGEYCVGMDGAQFRVTAIASPTDIPGVTIVEAPTHHRRNGRIEIPDEAVAEILPWANGDGAQTVKGWYSRAFRAWSPSDVENMVFKFSTVFLSSEKAATRNMMETDPLSFFKKRFSGFIVDQPAFDRLNAPKEGGPTRNAQQPPANFQTQIRH